MMDPASLATAAVAVLSPYLVEGGKEMAKTVGKEAATGGLKLLGWLKGRLTGAGAEALAEVEQAPADQDAQGALRLQVRKLLEREPGLQEELRGLLATIPATLTGQKIEQVGDQNRAAAVAGQGHTVTVS